MRVERLPTALRHQSPCSLSLRAPLLSTVDISPESIGDAGAVPNFEVWKVENLHVRSHSVERSSYEEAYRRILQAGDDRTLLGLRIPIKNYKSIPLSQPAIRRLIGYFRMRLESDGHVILPSTRSNPIHVLFPVEDGVEDVLRACVTAIVFQPQKNLALRGLEKALARIFSVLNHVQTPVAKLHRFVMPSHLFSRQPRPQGVRDSFERAGWDIRWIRDADPKSGKFRNVRWHARSPFDPSNLTYVEFPCFPDKEPVRELTLYLDHDKPNGADRLFHMSELEKIFGKSN